MRELKGYLRETDGALNILVTVAVENANSSDFSSHF